MQHVVYYLLFSLISVFTVNTQTNRTLHTDAEIQAYLDDIVNNKKFRRNGHLVGWNNQPTKCPLRLFL